MIGAGGWGLLAASSLVLGSLLAFAFRIPRTLLGLIMGFGSGVLISAVAYELVLDATEKASTAIVVGVAFGAGALVFFAGDVVIERRGRAMRRGDALGAGSGGGLAIALGAVLDGIPESVTLGISLIGGGGVSITLLVAIFISNVPEGIAASSGMLASGWTRARVLGLWSLVALVSGLAALLGYGLLGDASGDLAAAVEAFAGGAILTMLADSMVPEAYDHAGPPAGLATALGFALAFGLSSL